jgi:hypothetical protein
MEAAMVGESWRRPMRMDIHLNNRAIVDGGSFVLAGYVIGIVPLGGGSLPAPVALRDYLLPP